MEAEEEDAPPTFWTENGGHRRLRRSYSLFLSSGAVLICVLVIALAFMLVIIPTIFSALHSFPYHLFKPNSVKKSWDSLNFVLILFAILCAFLSRDSTNESFSDTPHQYEKPSPATTPPWYEEPDRTPYKSYNRLRSFNSYPDLRQESPWLASDERWRFYDDTHVNGYSRFDFEEQSVKKIEVVDKEVPPSPPSPASPPPVPREENKNKNKERSATKESLTSLKGKKKKQSFENLKHIRNSEPHSQPRASSVFHTLFPSKKRKRKKVESASSPHFSLSKTEPVRGSVASSLESKKIETFSKENVAVTGNESPLITIPPPPPPPFKMPAWKFRVQGDFVRINSISSSSGGSPDLEDEVVESGRSEDGEESAMLLFYDPSPDVDTKADTFIERFRAGLRMEEKQGIGTSNLRPSPKPKAV
ncbi:uncharacterized protein [Phaseolus vulgaris]|uniref:Hydroxyproline-rich glycoprotein family protein n=1 Tax=Phaseolus vulgaris TaxID=3885 RepID=V7BWU1_PHAVU|nr:hypothetical protein PHAVU_005G156400g [Phaseolus vulgaris]ESW22477.1 hypothetical protein PHAVU_005G156400g [Phaseolus vulgaris]